MTSELQFPFVTNEAPDVVERATLSSYPRARLHLLGNGEVTTAVTILGEGFTTWNDLDVYRFREDASVEAGGIYFYLRDRESKRTWSAGFRPTGAEPDGYEVSFAVHHVEISRRDGDIETTMEIAVSPERPAEVRRLTLINHGADARDIEVTTATEVVLAPRAADLAHRAFASMFLEAEALPERNAMLVRRRPRSPSEIETWVVQVLATEDEGWSGAFEHEASRARFVGRGRTMASPAGLDAPLTGTTGAVLDPLVALRRTVHLEPGARARITLSTAVATTRASAIELLNAFAKNDVVHRTFSHARVAARAELDQLGVRPSQSHTFQRLLSAIVFPQRDLRSTVDPGALRGGGRAALWALGLSDLPLAVVRIDDVDAFGLFGELLVAHEVWRRKGVQVELLALDEGTSGEARADATLASLIRSSPDAYRLEQRGGILLRRARDLTDEDLALIMANARVVLRTSGGSLARQLRLVEREAYPRPLRRTRKPEHDEAHVLARPPLAFDNGYGGMAADGRYVMTVRADQLPPMPWCNVLANPRFGAIVSEGGSSTTWSENSQQHRLTPWSNDPIGDPSGEIIYVRDDDDGTAWSATPLPAGGDATYLVEHGQGWSSFSHTRSGLVHRLTVHVDGADPVKTWRLTIQNDGARVRRLSLTMLAEWVLGSTRDQSRVSVVTEWDAISSALVVSNPLSLFPSRRAFVAASAPVASYAGDREEVYGASASRARPEFLDRTALSNRVGSGRDPCGALQLAVTIQPGERIDVAFLVGEGKDLEDARELLVAHRDLAACDRSLMLAKAAWRDLLGAVVVNTPDEALNAIANRWLLYQVTSCRLWGRTAFYQSSGAYGFRDQIQDVLALVHARPDLVREHLLRAAARQFVEGDVQHWWSGSEGIRTRFSDDLLWLPFAVADYVVATGDDAILGERVPFLKERALASDDEDLFSSPTVTEETATLYEHCARALDRASTRGAHGLPKMGSGDWNDGMNRVGRGGEGESVWLAWFLATTARKFAVLAAHRGDHERVRWCNALQGELAVAVDAAWDGAWYRRAWFDDGTPLGSHANVECRIDAIAQSWSVIAGIGDPAKAREAVASAERELVSPEHQLMRLLTPPFEVGEPDPGYIRAYPAGLRENGGQYTHGVLWTVQALAILGEGDRATALLSMLNPMNHARTPEEVARYQVEPYVVAADVYAAPGHVGRGGWTWYSGAASVMYRVLLHDILGIKREGANLRIDPCIARSWSSFEVTYRDGEGAVHVRVENPNGVSRGVASIEIDGAPVADGVVPLTGRPGVREVRVVMGQSQPR
jgi:cyclic beta-1,2-glucan synthetase